MTCDAGGQTGSIQFCSSNTCEACNTTRFDNFRCLPSDASFGSSSVSIDCFGQNEPALPADYQPRPGDFSATWYAGECPCSAVTVKDEGILRLQQ